MARASSSDLQNLRMRIAQLEGFERAAGHLGQIGLGVSVIDQALRGGLSVGRVHEFAGAAANGFVTALLARQCRREKGDVLWLCDMRTPARPYPPGLVSLGLDPAHIVFAACTKRDDVLWGAEEALGSGAVCAVVAEMNADFGGSVSLTASRRLQLAAEKGGAIGFVLTESRAAVLAPNALTTRWRVTAAPSDIEGLKKTHWHNRWQLQLRRQRVGETGQWMVDWHDETHTFSLVSETSDGPFVAPSVPRD